MRRFNPGLPTDQLAKYKTSQHGMLLLGKGDSRAAQCASCHGLHGIRGVKSPASKVYPKNIPDTCGVCHSSAEVMAGLTLADGSPMPTDQVDKYRGSVHGRALLERGDIGAAVCNDCHGNHAAVPPGVASVAQICRTCHAGNATLFAGSKHKEAFDRNGWPECTQCHGKHAISETDDAMLGSGESSMCADCHAKYAQDNPNCAGTVAYFRDSIVELRHALETFEVRIEELAEKGLDVEPLGDQWTRLGDSVQQSRSYIHSFDRSDFRQAADPGREAISAMTRLVEEAEIEYRERRTGLLVSVFMIGLLALLIYLKLRRMEKGQ
jgi:predicted CXXCH cytochrome family protein